MRPWEPCVALGGSPGTWEELGGPLASFEILWGSLEVLWGPRGSLGGSLGVPCRSLMCHRLVLTIIEKQIVFSILPSIEAPWGTPGRSLEVLGDSGAPLGVSWALSRASWDLVEVLGCLWGDSLGVLRGVYGVHRGSLGDGSGNPEFLVSCSLASPTQQTY